MTVRFAVLISVCLLSMLGVAQEKANPTNVPAATQRLLNGVKSESSRDVIKSVLMIECPKDGKKGTGFVVSNGEVITTNAHVVGTCAASDLQGTSPVKNEPVKFSDLRLDTNRDLAVLCPTEKLPYSLKLGGDENATVETDVETWGYPLRYNGPAPILSRGYVAGYALGIGQNGQPKNPAVHHLIVNGALNPGNSGGPLIDRSTGKVIGVVVEKWMLFSPNIENVLEAFQHPGATLGGGAPIYITYPNGEVKSVGQTEAIRVSIEELYRLSQVMVGEAISVSELNSFIKGKGRELQCAAH